MIQIQMLTLYGTPCSIETARMLLEKQEHVKLLEKAGDSREFQVVFSGHATENDLVVLLAQSGIDGFKLAKHPGHR